MTEEVLCLATLVASGELPPSATVKDSETFFTEETGGDCSKCPFAAVCLATIIHE